jgi:hypothetical protein
MNLQWNNWVQSINGVKIQTVNPSLTRVSSLFICISLSAFFDEWRALSARFLHALKANKFERATCPIRLAFNTVEFFQHFPPPHHSTYPLHPLLCLTCIQDPNSTPIVDGLSSPTHDSFSTNFGPSMIVLVCRCKSNFL